ncbi:lipopolysaccharide heptosyltransferase I [Helicobacter valdiviensis]|uniref:Lipopolysaccharide heptosyltransferase 1 n=1 Tax=Helicobacter valdiviensis TaxID=1458358 RepID=A0A2W6MUE4_9HELI|nr:lipopolysaccharide heptosyltransferase I [Helicobacter valdiviensis]PZT48134.1 lipopolysaccharide heptosyltransferase I [Helicobacter valdiviensis]
MLKIAIVRLSAMGDIIHSASILPLFLKCLYEIEPNITLHWYVDSIFAEILEDSPLIHKVIPLPLKQSIQTKNFKQLFAIYKTLKKEKYDYVLDLQGLLKSAIIGKILPSKNFIGFDRKSIKEPLASLFYTKKIHSPYEEHILLRNAKLAFLAFGLQYPTLEQLLASKNFLGHQKQDFFSQTPKKVLFVLETSKLNKTYPLNSFLELAKLFNTLKIKPILLSHKTPLPQSQNYYSIHSLNLKEVKSLLANMDLVIGGDTGITHLAWALSIPSITLFGATPKARFSLQTKINLSLEANKNANYDKKDFSIQNIQPIDIFSLAQSLLKEVL